MPHGIGPTASLAPLIGLLAFVVTLLLLWWKVGLKSRVHGADPIDVRASRLRLEGVSERGVQRYVERERAKRRRRRR